MKTAVSAIAKAVTNLRFTCGIEGLLGASLALWGVTLTWSTLKLQVP